MRKCLYLLALVSTLLVFGGVANAQYPIMDQIANKIVQRYQQSSRHVLPSWRSYFSYDCFAHN
jgi:hypothetical protein